MDKPEINPQTPHSWGHDRRHWHLDKTISVGHLLSTVVIAVSVFSWASAVDRRVEQNAQAIDYLKREQVRQSQNITGIRTEFKNDFRQIEQRMDAVRGEIKSDLSGINEKLDRLIEKRMGN